MRVVADRLSLRWYLGYGLDEPLPDHSSLTRIRERLGLSLFQFHRVCFRWKPRPERVVGDAKFGTIANIRRLEDAGVHAFLPMPELGRRFGFYFQRPGRFNDGAAHGGGSTLIERITERGDHFANGDREHLCQGIDSGQGR